MNDFYILAIVPADEPTPQEQQQQLMNFIHSMMATTQQPPAATVPKSTSHAPQQHSGLPPAQAISLGGRGVPVAPSAVHQPTTNSEVCDTVWQPRSQATFFYTHVFIYAKIDFKRKEGESLGGFDHVQTLMTRLVSTNVTCIISVRT